MARNDSSNSRTLGELAELVKGAVRGDSSRQILGVNGLQEANPGDISFYSNNPRYRQSLEQTKASAVLVDEASVALVNGPDALVVADPYLSFAKISTLFNPRVELSPGIDARAYVDSGAFVAPSATVMAFCYVSRGAKIGAGSIVYPFVFVGEDTIVGAGVTIHPHVVIRERCVVGDRAILQPGVVIGADGFGYVFDREKMQHQKIAQIGVAEIQADVEIGANSAIDRATVGNTVIGKGSKLDNLVQVGHNVKLGPLCILCGQVGIAGSAELGAGVVCGGQVGINNLVKIVDGARIGGHSGIKDDIDKPGEYLGAPAIPVAEFARCQIAFRRGGETLRVIRRLEKRVAELEAKLAATDSKP